MKRLTIILAVLGMNLTTYSQVKTIAHRGASFTAPENTVAAAKQAWAQNADAVELDIYLTKDSKVVVIHDKSTKRTTGVDLLVAESTSEELRKLDAGSFKGEQYKGEKIPFLEEMIATVPSNKQLIIELKCGVEVLPYLKEVVEKSGKKSSCCFIGFDWNTIAETKKMFPTNPCYWLTGKKDLLMEKLKATAEAGIDGVDLHYKIIDEEVVNAAKQENLKVIAWTVDDIAEAKRLKELGVEGITTNKPAEIKSAL